MNPAAPEIDAVLQTMAERWNRHDTRAYVSLWTEDCSFVNVLGMHRRGRRELLAELDFLHAGRFKDTQVRMERTSLRFLTPEAAVVTARWHMRGDPGMPGFPTQNGERRGVFTHVLQRTPEGWRCVASQNTDVLPIPDPIQAALAQPEALATA